MTHNKAEATGLVDTHCHLELIAETGNGEVEKALAEAREVGVDAVVNIGLGDDNAAVVERARTHDGVYAALGWHPHQKRPPTDDELAVITTLAADPRVVAIGEIGLDYYWRPGYHEVPVEVQKQGFRQLLELARKTGLPVAVHNREAHADTLEVLKDFEAVPVVMHAFSGDQEFAATCVARGYMVSVAGPITYPSAGVLRNALQVVPLDHLVVETDAPFLPPQPWRGKASRPAMVSETARALAELKGVRQSELTAQLRANVSRVFGIGPG
ncbi:MAG: TatD family hydrolase [Candidatus Dormiibacterota bacterium]